MEMLHSDENSLYPLTKCYYYEFVTHSSSLDVAVLIRKSLCISDSYMWLFLTIFISFENFIVPLKPKDFNQFSPVIYGVIPPKVGSLKNAEKREKTCKTNLKSAQRSKWTDESCIINKSIKQITKSTMFTYEIWKISAKTTRDIIVATDIN